MYRQAFPWALCGLFLTLLAPARGNDNLTLLGEKGTFLGALFAASGEDPRPPRPPGARITHVLPRSPAEKAGLRRDDVLLQYDSQRIRDPEHLARLIRTDRAGRKVRLLVNRGGKEQLHEATLSLGPVLNLAAGAEARAPKDPAAVSISATPLKNGDFRVTIEYTARGRPQVVTCQGGADLASAVEKLPERERKMARAALQRLHLLKDSPRAPAPQQKR